jgi:hypothetical protein
MATALVATAPATTHAAVPAAPNDSIRLREALEGDIAKFQQRWRDLWLKSIIAGGGGWMNMEQVGVDERFGFYSPDLLRLSALNCYLDDAPLQLLFGGRASRVPSRSGGTVPLLITAPRRITGQSTRASVCPQWIPLSLGITVDEGVRLDLALAPKTRTYAGALRRALIQRLDNAAEQFPGDQWITEQRVRFLLDNEDLTRALEVARSCDSSHGWCSALEGLVLAQSGNLVAAEAAFLRGARTPDGEAAGVCADTSARPLFNHDVRRAMRNASCGEWNAIEQRLWWLSKPLWKSEANERLVEHYARRTLLTLRTALDEDERYIWRRTAAGDALEEVIMRYGWPTHTWWGGYHIDGKIADFAQARRNPAEYPYTVKEYAPDRVAVVPDFRAIANPFNALDSDWQWDRPENVAFERWFPQEHMQLGTRLARLPQGQSVMLRRDTSVLYGHVIDEPVYGLDPAETSALRAYMITSESPTDEPVVRNASIAVGRSLRVAAQLPSTPTVVSLEVPNRNENEVAYRRRFGLRPPPSLSQMGRNEVALSDPTFLLLPAFGAPAITNPDSALAHIASSTNLPRNVPLALYWESYGFAPNDTVDVQLRILRQDGSALRSIGAFFGVADARRDSVSIGWREPDRGRSTHVISAVRPAVARAVTVDVRSLEPGTYVFRVEMRRPGGVTAVSERRVEIVP